MTGSLDTNTYPHLAKDYVATLRQRGVDASYVEVAGAAHNFSRTISESPQFDAALRSLLGSYNPM